MVNFSTKIKLVLFESLLIKLAVIIITVHASTAIISATTVITTTTIIASAIVIAVTSWLEFLIAFISEIAVIGRAIALNVGGIGKLQLSLCNLS